MKKVFKISFALASITLLVGCNLEVNPTGTALMTAINYTEPERIIYSRDDTYTTPNGERKVNKGDFKPVWNALQNRLGVNLLEHQAAANSGTKKSVDYFRDNWMTKTYADITMGTVYDINNYSVAGNAETILDLKPYIDQTKKFIPNPDKPGEDIYDPDVPEGPGPLPNIATFLHNNPGVRMSITTAKHSHPDQGAIYFVPYCDGFNDLERGLIMRADYVRRLLDDDPGSTTHPFSDKTDILGKAGDAKYSQHFEPCYLDGSGNAPMYIVKVPNANANKDEEPVIEIKKRGAVRNIIDRQNELIKEGKASSKNLAHLFRDYIDQRYEQDDGSNPFTNHYSDLFLGQNACYDADELVALMRLVKVSSGTLFGKTKKGEWVNKEMVTMMPRTCDNMRASDLYRWAGQVFGVRGLDSRINSYIYISGTNDYGEEYGKYGAIHDARGSKEMLELLKKMKNLYSEGLILQNFDDMTATASPKGEFANDTLYSGGSDNYAGFMVYDFPNDLNDWNKYASKDKNPDYPCTWETPGDNGSSETEGQEGYYPYQLRMVVGATAKWDVRPDLKEDDPDRYEWMPFTESWASVKTSAACLNARLPQNPEKLEAAFKLIDFVYGDEGSFLYNYGSWQDGYVTEIAGTYDKEKGLRGVYSPNAEHNRDYISYQGLRYPMLTPEALEQFQKTSGIQRQYMGAGLPFGFIKLKSIPYQTMEQKTKDGVDIVNSAIQYGTFKHVLIGGYTEQQKEDYKIPFYQICPSSFFLTKGQSSAISSLLDKNKLGSMFTDSSSSNFNIWDALIMGKETRQGVTLDNYLETMEKWGVRKLETYYQDAFEIMSKPVE